MKRKILRKSEIKALNQELNDLYGVFLYTTKDRTIVYLKDGDLDLILVNDEPEFFKFNDVWIPTLRLILRNNFLKTILVDMGAIKFVTNGSDIMRPGIVKFEAISKDDLVVVADETHNKPLSIGKALISSDEFNTMTKGKAIKNLHCVGDDIWNYGKNK